MRIYNGRLITIENGTFPCGYVDFEEEKITAFGPMEKASAYDGPALDAKGGWIMPGLIDAHTHIGICEESSGGMGNDCNESSSPDTPEMRAIDGVNPWDPSIKKSRDAGVTTVGICPGSANVIGGQIAAMKLAGETVEEMSIKSCAAIKMAMGENPKKTYGQGKGVAPKTRMAIAAILRKYLTNAQRYAEKKDAGEKVCDLEMEALLPLVRGEIPVHFHAHEADDILTAMRIAHEFNLKYSIVHATDAGRIIPKFVSEGSIPMVGPSSIWSSKHEMMNNSMATPGLLNKAGVEVAITTDHDVTPLWLLPLYAGLAVREGMQEDAAFRAITINGAKAMGVDDRVGSIAVGKDADIVVYSGHPFQYLTKVEAVFVNGKQYK